MATTKKQSPEEPTPVNGQTPDEASIIAEQTAATPESPMTGEQATALMNETGLEQLVAQRKALGEQIKATKASQPNVSALEKIIARQATQPKWLVEVLTGRVRARVQAGQSQDGALDAVLHSYRVLITAALAEASNTEEEAQS